MSKHCTLTESISYYDFFQTEPTSPTSPTEENGEDAAALEVVKCVETEKVTNGDAEPKATNGDASDKGKLHEYCKLCTVVMVLTSYYLTEKQSS